MHQRIPAGVCCRHQPLGSCAHVKLPEHLISKEAACAFVDRAKKREIKWQLLLGCKKTLSKALGKLIKQPECPSGSCTWWPGSSGRASSYNRMKRLPTVYMLALWEHPPSSKSLLFTVVPLSWQCSRTAPCAFHKSAIITYPGDGWVLNFILTGDVWCFHSILWCFLSGV